MTPKKEEIRIFTGVEIHDNVVKSIKGPTGMYIMTSRHEFVSKDDYDEEKDRAVSILEKIKTDLEVFKYQDDFDDEKSCSILEVFQEKIDQAIKEIKNDNL